ncbi:MAG: DUF1553 domain-containing protein [Gemmataceae bacterium]|nr:DUF1553 domain-containing protein [Gemmataceae bacterium]
MRRFTLSLCTLLLSAVAVLGQAPVPDAAARKFFETNVRPVLANRCFQCHGPEMQKGKLRVDSLSALVQGGRSGSAFKAGKPDESLLIQAIRHDGLVQMPPKMKLPAKEIADLTAWIKMGAPWPDAKVVAKIDTKDHEPVFTKEQINHWAFQPVKKPTTPTVKNADWVRSPIDAFVLAGLEAKGLKPAPTADARTLIRRVYFDLIGLPPPVEVVEVFVKDCEGAGAKRGAALAKVVDELLASPRYGERWARHWLDLVRYADSNGMDENLVFGNAWRYRDYVIAAFNSDKPYDQFVREQIAGDLLKNQEITATGFLCIGPKMLAEDDPVKMEMDIIDEQLDTLGRAFLGMTFGCARCHDHKYDPISSSDYYALAGILKSTKTMDNFRVVARWQERPNGSAGDIEKAKVHTKRIAELKEEIKKIKDVIDLKEKHAQLAKFEKMTPAMSEAMAVSDAKATDLRIHLRGNHLALGKEAPRRFPRVFTSLKQSPIDAVQSGRLQFAEWITQPEHPLTSRVMVNRLWHWHFGTGLVRTVDNFGLLGDKPSHPELLDWLAAQFVESGWSIKAMHRAIVLSSTYQMSGAYQEGAFQIDPDNRLHWRHSRRRLEAEALRDSLYVLASSLDASVGGTLFVAKNRAYVPGYPNGIYDKYDIPRRSIYLPVIRSAGYDVLQAFDFADPSFSSGERATTTVAPQALFLMNGKIVHEQTRIWSAKLLAEKTLDDAGRVRRIYTQALGRPPSEKEITRSLEFVQRIESELARAKTADSRSQAWQSFCRVIVSANEFVYVE